MWISGAQCLKGELGWACELILSCGLRSCLFNRGQTLEVPELVPFRMTQNMVDAFGVTGIEGMPHETKDLFSCHGCGIDS